MVKIKSAAEINKMRNACRLAARLLRYIEPYVTAGRSTGEINDICAEYMASHGATSATLNYRGYPKAICTSVNNVVCHGIPDKTQFIKDGDIINIDVTVLLNGYHGDTSRTFLIGNVSEKAKLLCQRAEQAMYEGIRVIRPGLYLNEIGNTIDSFVAKYGYSVVRALGGHGIGRVFHEDPFVFHFKNKVKGPRLKQGMIFTVEPMINEGGFEVVTDPVDKWTVTTCDGSLSAQFEHTVLVTDSGNEILTSVPV